MYESTLFILPLYSISLFSRTATLRFIARCRVESGRFGCGDDGEDDDNLVNHFASENAMARIKRFLCASKYVG
jgi:hypothetical protein